MASSSYHYFSRYPHKSNRRPPTLEEMLAEIPPGETNAYYEKLIESEGFDVSGFPRAYLYGTICPYSIGRDEDRRERVSELAKKAIDLYNQDNDSSYEFVEVVRASWEVIAGFIYYITFVVKSCTTNNQSNFQAKVIVEVQKPVVVEFCRPEGSGEKPLHHSPMHLINAYSVLYQRMFTKSEGFDVPDIPNSISIRVPGIFRPMKYTDDVEKLSKLCNLSADHYSKEKQVNCRFFKFLQANKRVGRDGDDYHIELLVILEDGKYQILQARVSWNGGENPCVELCREKPPTATPSVEKLEESFKKLPISSSPKKPKGDEWSMLPTNFPPPT